ncbi:MAG: primosomal protein N' [Bacillota bacterium]|nr:primosomal protein N' [Bacillota bacterium]
MYCQLIINKTSRNIDRKFTYKIPTNIEDYLMPGMRVLVDFNNQEVEGTVVNKIEKTDISDNKIKYIKNIVDDIPIITDEILMLTDWIREEYVCRYIDAIKLFYPPSNPFNINYYIDIKDKKYTGDSRIYNILKSKNEAVSIKDLFRNFKSLEFLKELYKLHYDGIVGINIVDNSQKNKKFVRVVDIKDTAKEYNIRSNAHKQKDLIEYLMDKGTTEQNELIKNTNSTLSSLKSLQEKKIVEIIEKENIENLETKDRIKESRINLNIEQKEAIHKIIQEENQFNLIHGVTGSGKTEIYMHIIERNIKVNKKIIMLFPEISLTNHMINRFTKRFGNRVAVIHSRMKSKRRYEEWDKINKGYKDIIIGARSALFTPVRNLGAIIIDEEHDDSYNSSITPKYKTVDVAEKLSQITGCKLILGSATPSINSYYKSKKNLYNLIEIKKRINDVKLPETLVIDMKKELDEGNKNIFSRELYESIKRTLDKKQQVILFLNKRGYSSFVSCRSCGYVVKCDRCDVSMTYHSSNNKLICHYCGNTKQVDNKCPSCGSKYFKTFGVGTQRIEKITKKMFPNKNVDRMDFDTVTKKGAQERIYKDLATGKTDILIGTQMLAKGIHFPNVTLVGIISADITINLPFYTASEKSFQLITQVSGRAGRGSKLGKVILQTYEPEHYSIKYAISNNYKEFFKQEISLRREFKYPPYIKILYINTKSKKEIDLKKFNSKKYKKVIENLKDLIENGYIKVYKPVPKGIYKVNNEYQIDTIIKTRSDKIQEIKELLRKIYFNKSYKNISVSIEIDPNTIS